jgi:hypothetical protein
MMEAKYYVASLKWLGSGDTGTSSTTLVYAALELELFRPDFPHDPADLGRCIRMLEKLPWVREPAFTLLQNHPVWKHLIGHWDDLVKLYHEEEPSGRAPLTYDLMQELIYRGRYN